MHAPEKQSDLRGFHLVAHVEANAIAVARILVKVVSR